MATTTSITTTYAGESKNQIISAALLAGNTLAQNAITFKPNIVGKEVVRRLETDGLFRGATCDFADTSTITSTERIIEPKEFQVNLELCKTDWFNDWNGYQMGASAFRNMPSTIQEYILQYVAAKVAQNNENLIWAGEDSADSYDGFATLLAADSDLPVEQRITGTTVASSNVLDEMGKVYAAIPKALFGSPELCMYVSQDVYKAYAIALGGFSAQGQGANGINAQGLNQSFAGLQYAGVNVFMANGLPSSTMILAEKSNLWFGTSIASDWNEVRLLDMADLDGSKNIRVIMRFLAGVQYGVVEDIVAYGLGA
jgi:hypothetical protein